MISPVLFVAAIFSTAALAVDPVVNLGYSQYRGIPLANGITQWLGIRFAAAPLGDLRFRAPQDPPTISGTQIANQVVQTP
jgi:carboxylesterase type B